MKNSENFDAKELIEIPLSTIAWFSLGLPVINKNSKSEMMKDKNQQVRAGFSKVRIDKALSISSECRSPLEASLVVVLDVDVTITIVSLDLIYLLPHEHDKIQSELADLTGIPAKNILLHTTHTHSAPWDLKSSEISYDNLPEVLAHAITDAKNNVQTVYIKRGMADVGNTLSVYRRKNTGDDLGVQTFWFGYQIDKSNGKPDASALVNEMKCRWQNKEPEYKKGDKPLYFDHPVDSCVNVIAFEDNKGNVLGSIIRFSAHPHLTSACRKKLYDPDFPGHTRKYIEDKLGGVCMFLLGTAADIVPKEDVEYKIDTRNLPDQYYFGPSSAFLPVDENKLLAETYRIGRAIGEKAVISLKGVIPEPLTSLSFKYTSVDMPLDPLLPKNHDDIQKIKNILIPEYQAFLNQGGAVNEMRCLANRFNWLEWAASKSFTFCTKEEKDLRSKKMPLWFLRFNKERLIFMHSEISSLINEKIKKLTNDPNILVISMTGGYIGYFVTKEMMDEGGYEGRSSVLQRNADEILYKHINYFP